MAAKQEVWEKINKALNERTGGQKPCPVCGETAWYMADAFFVMPVGKNPTAMQFGPASMPLLPVVCTHCGNTNLLNLMVLGFTDLSLLKIDDDAPAKP
jgi:hypothetical protein